MQYAKCGIEGDKIMSIDMGAVSKQVEMLRKCRDEIIVIKSQLLSRKEELNNIWCANEMQYINIAIDKIDASLLAVSRDIENVQKEINSAANEILEEERIERERQERERLERERQEKERQERERQEQERQEQERLERERQEQERIEQERQQVINIGRQVQNIAKNIQRRFM